jgi:hypothetical protein
VPYTLKKQARIIGALNQWYHKKMHKFRIRIPKTVKEAYAPDKENGNNQQ